MKRTWITVKRGILEPKHRFALGELIYLFMFILDKTNWESGVIEDWLDIGASEEMEMPVETLRDQRRKLETKGYITCERKQRGIRVIVHNWTNPKEYTGKKYNIKSPDCTPDCTPDFKSPEENTLSSYSHKSKVINQKSKDKSALDPFSKMQIIAETITGTPVMGEGNIKAIDELVKMGATKEDVQKGYNGYTKDHVFKYYSSIVGWTKTEIAKRIQEERKDTSKLPRLEVGPGGRVNI